MLRFVDRWRTPNGTIAIHNIARHSTACWPTRRWRHNAGQLRGAGPGGGLAHRYSKINGQILRRYERLVLDSLPKTGPVSEPAEPNSNQHLPHLPEIGAEGWR